MSSESEGTQEEMQAIVVRLNDFEARYIAAQTAHVAHPTLENWQALHMIGDAYENAIQVCWDRGIRPLWNRTEGTYTIE